MKPRLLLTCLVAVFAHACDKVPITNIQTAFTLSDAAWFEAEQTLFYFYRVQAEQGLGPESLLEVTYRTDDVDLPWTPLEALTPVHTHVFVDCGSKARCGSFSLKVPLLPRSVGIRLRFHRDGELSLVAPKQVFNAVRTGAPEISRSLLVYGVFDESNTHVQWRTRHQFPTLRNGQVQELGLRRFFRVEETVHGALPAQTKANPYGYGFSSACPSGFQSLGFEPAESWERAMFQNGTLPLSASTSSGVCANATVTDATGMFVTAALARKNPEVRPAFPILRNPNHAGLHVGFLLKPCAREISQTHLAMQQQRLLLESPVVVCVDDWRQSDFASRLATALQMRIDVVRSQGEDMALVVAIHHDDATGGLSAKVEEAFEKVLPDEGLKSSPRVSSAFVLDSYGHELQRASLSRLVMWCPSPEEKEDEDPEKRRPRTCPVVADASDLKLGPFRLGALPIFPTRDQYARFRSQYTEAQAGRVRALRFLAPERTPLSENIPVGEGFETTTFFNNETLSALPGEAFSFCPSFSPPVVFRPNASAEPRPLSELPLFHASSPQGSYGLGVLWSYPFLTRVQYEATLAATATVFSVSVPFGLTSTVEPPDWGAALWEASEIPMGENTLIHCTRFCAHPTFDSSRVYNVGVRFNESYAQRCYAPKYPALDDGGFPFDP
ncbi:MAG: hypothetical protein ACT4TC_11595 [Myxococcaceae bacterium]